MNGCERWVLCCHARLPEGRRYAVGHETKGIMTENRNILALDASKIGKRAYRKWLFWLSGLHPDDLIFSRCPCPCILVIKKQMGGSTTLFLTHFCPTLTPRHHGANYGLHARAAQQRHCPSRQRCASHQGAVSAAGCRGCVGLSLCQGLVARQKDPALEKRLAGETPAGWNSFYQMFVYLFFWFFVKGWIRATLWATWGADPQLLWAHPTSHATGAPDLYTPLSSVLLASPRHRLAAMLQKWGLADEKDAAVQMQLGGANAATAVASVAHKKVWDEETNGEDAKGHWNLLNLKKNNELLCLRCSPSWKILKMVFMKFATSLPSWANVCKRVPSVVGADPSISQKRISQSSLAIQ